MREGKFGLAIASWFRNMPKSAMPALFRLVEEDGPTDLCSP